MFVCLILYYIDSNSSIRFLVLPCLICFSVLYLSRPSLTFSWWVKSSFVNLCGSLAWFKSRLNSLINLIIYILLWENKNIDRKIIKFTSNCIFIFWFLSSMGSLYCSGGNDSFNFNSTSFSLRPSSSSSFSLSLSSATRWLVIDVELTADELLVAWLWWFPLWLLLWLFNDDELPLWLLFVTEAQFLVVTLCKFCCDSCSFRCASTSSSSSFLAWPAFSSAKCLASSAKRRASSASTTCKF